MSKKRLGRGLDALLSAVSDAEDRRAQSDRAQSGGAKGRSATSSPQQSDLAQLAVIEVFPGRYQPRRGFDEESLGELADSIRAQGVMQPVVVRARAQGGYEMVAGERRWRAAKLAGLTTIPAVIKQVSDEQASAMALIENIQREDLNPLEEAAALERLRDEFKLTQQQVANAVGKSRVAVTNLLRLLNLAPEVRELLQIGSIEMGHARALLSLDSLEQIRVAQEVAGRHLSVRQTEALVRQLLDRGSNRRPASVKKMKKDPDTVRLEQELSDRVGAPVSISDSGNGSGQLCIRYSSLEELDGILGHLR